MEPQGRPETLDGVSHSLPLSLSLWRSSEWIFIFINAWRSEDMVVTSARHKEAATKREASPARKTISSDTGAENSRKELMDSRHNADHDSPYFDACL